jgi:hypothetical protein
MGEDAGRRPQLVSNRAVREVFDVDGVCNGAVPPQMLDHLLAGRGAVPTDKARGIDLMSTVVRSARSISGRASLTDRAAGRLEFQARTIWRPRLASGSIAGTNNTGRSARNKRCSANV